MGLEIRLTGRLGVEGERGALDSSDLPGRQGRLVLAFLALNHNPVPRDELAELVWAEGLPRSWERDLSSVVSKLKALFLGIGAEDALSGAAGCYELRLPPGTTIDVDLARLALEEAEEARREGSLEAALAAASRAAELARRPFLPGDEGAWIEACREELRSLAVQACEVQATCHRARGETAAAIRAATAATQLDPFRESSHAVLMRLHLEAGNRAEALRAYERCRALLVAELGVPPGPEVEAVHAEALRLDLDAHQPTRSLPPPVSLALAAGLLVGRGEQLARLRAAWEEAAQGQSRFVLVAGEPGIGKTRLASELAAEAHAAGAQVLYGRCDQEPLASYQPFTEALRQWVASAPAAEVRAAGEGTAGPLAPLLPELAARVGVPPGESPHDRLTLYDAVGRLLASIARAAPALLLIDDLHAADLPTLALLRRLARSARPTRVLCACTYRHAEPQPRAQLAEIVAELRLDGLAEEILLPGLDADATAALVEARSGRRPTASEARSLRERTGGNPLFLVAVADSADGAGETAPPGLGDAIGRHLSRLPEAARAALATAAILGHELDLDVLAEIAGLERTEVADELQPALAAQLLAEDQSGVLSFAHPLVRETLYDGLSSGRRTELHARAAAALAARRPGAVQALAHHLVSAGRDHARAVEYAVAAAREAIARLAFEDAIEILDRTLEIVPANDAEARRRIFTARTPASTGLWHAVYEGSQFRVAGDAAGQPTTKADQPTT